MDTFLVNKWTCSVASVKNKYVTHFWAKIRKLCSKLIKLCFKNGQLGTNNIHKSLGEMNKLCSKMV